MTLPHLVVAAVQDPHKDVLPFRDLLPTELRPRLTEADQATVEQNTSPTGNRLST